MRRGNARFGKRDLGYQGVLNAMVLGLFANSEPGWLFDNSRADTLFSDLAGTVPAVLDGPIGKQLDLSGSGNHRTTTSTANRPTWSGKYNGIKYSEAVQNAAWTKNNVTPTLATGLTLPSKYSAASLITSNAGAGAHYSVQTGTNSYLAGSSVTLTAWVQKGNQQYFVLGDQNDAVYHNATFDLNAGTVSGQTNAVGTIVSDGGSGYFLKTVYTCTNTNTGSIQYGVATVANVATVPSYTAAGTETVYVTGLDTRPTNQATGLIPTYQWATSASGAGTYDLAGFPLYIKPNGSNQFLYIPSLALGTSTMFLATGVRKTATSTALLTEFSVNSAANGGAFYLGTSVSGSNDGALSNGTSYVGANAAIGTAPYTEVFSALLSIAAPVVTLRADGVQVATNTASQGTGVYGTYPVYFFMRAGSTLPFSGLEFASIGRGASALPSAAQIAATEAWVNQRTRAY